MSTNPTNDMPTQDALSDEDRDIYELRYDLQQANEEVARLQQLADANGRNARAWGDRYQELDRACRDALGAHHRPGHSVAELITTMVAEVAQLARNLDAALGGEARARQECNELYEEVSLLKRQLANAQQAYSRTFDRMATIENEGQGR